MFGDLCQYKHILGKPNEGFHKHYFGFAIFDLIATVIAAFLLMLYFKNKTTLFGNLSHSLIFGIILLILLIIAEYLHIIFCIKE
jgi:hypothetical protein